MFQIKEFRHSAMLLKEAGELLHARKLVLLVSIFAVARGTFPSRQGRPETTF